MFILLLSLMSVSFGSEMECEAYGKRQFENVKRELVLEGKGIQEINGILQARIDICVDQCDLFMTGTICMATIKKNK
jgi:hypothetical protein